MKTRLRLFWGTFCCAALAVLAFRADAADLGGASLRVLHSFSGADGRTPVSSLLQDASGRLYGASRFGGPGDAAGVVFSVLADGSDFHVLHTFTNETQPTGLVLSTNGRLFGTLATFLATFEMNTDGSSYRVLRSVP